MTKLISIIVPIYNEEENIPYFHQKLVENLNNKYEYEIIFVNDGSTDQSRKIIKKLAEENSSIKHLEFSRNFGKEIALSAGIHHAKGEAAIMIDSDLQHPVEILPEFIKKWENGAEVVVGIRAKNKEERLLKKFGSFCFYKIMNLIGETHITPKSTDYRLLDKQVIDQFKKFTEKNRITRGLIEWLGFKTEHIHFEANERKNSKTKYSYTKLIKLALSSFVNHSLFPLKVAGYLGIIIMVISAPLGIFIIINKYIINDPWSLEFSGPAMLTVMNLFLIGIVLSCLGLIALYIANIHKEVINRPIYIIRKEKDE